MAKSKMAGRKITNEVIEKEFNAALQEIVQTVLAVNKPIVGIDDYISRLNTLKTVLISLNANHYDIKKDFKLKMFDKFMAYLLDDSLQDDCLLELNQLDHKLQPIRKNIATVEKILKFLE